MKITIDLTLEQAQELEELMQHGQRLLRSVIADQAAADIQAHVDRVAVTSADNNPALTEANRRAAELILLRREAAAKKTRLDDLTTKLTAALITAHDKQEHDK